VLTLPFELRARLKLIALVTKPSSVAR